jgi:YidC/Oxa1 family membrane protein insertase
VPGCSGARRASFAHGTSTNVIADDQGLASSAVRLWQDWGAVRGFRRLPARDRNIVFFSESRQDWHHLQPLIDFLTQRLSRTVCHVTSERANALPGDARDGVHAFRVRAGLVRTWFFQMVKADVFVLTMQDLGNFELKRSIHHVHYVYVFHNIGSTHMVDHADSYDHYDSIFCVGPHHEAEIRRREQLKGLTPKHLFTHGYPRLDALVRAAGVGRPGPAPGGPVALLAPTWGARSILPLCGEPLIAGLLEAGVAVILRPHYHTTVRTPELVRRLRDRFGQDARFRYVDRMEETQSLFDSDVLICDWSSMAMEYALGLGKPVLFVDVPPRVRNPDWAALGLEPLEMRIRREVGAVLPLDRLREAPACVAALARNATSFRARCLALREEWAFNPGRSAEVGAREIARIADECAGTGAAGRLRSAR